MNQQELVQVATTMRERARDHVARYAHTFCGKVSVSDVQAVIEAVGDISIVEAKAGLDRLQLEALELEAHPEKGPVLRLLES